MEINYKHPAFATWHLAEKPIRFIPVGALLKWHDGIMQYGFHLGDSVIAARDGLIRAEDLTHDPNLSWHDKKRVCVLAKDGNTVVFGEAAKRSEFQAGLYAKRQDFISACLGDDLGTFGNFPVWIFEHYGKCHLHPVTRDAEYEKTSPGSDFMQIFGKNLFDMTENVLHGTLYCPDTINHTGGQIMETLETRFRHFQQHSKGDGSLQSLTFWGDKSKIQILTNFRFTRHEIYIEYMRINTQEKYYRENVLNQPGYNAEEYDPTQWRIICCYEEIVKRVRNLHMVIEVFASTDSDLQQLVKPVPEFSINGSMWKEKMIPFRKQEEGATEKTKTFFFDSVSCCKSLLPLYEYLRDGGEFDREIEALIFGFYRLDMAQYLKDTGKDGF